MLFGLLHIVRECRHESNNLVIEKDCTIDILSGVNVGYEVVTYHFICRACSECVKIKYAREVK